MLANLHPPARASQTDQDVTSPDALDDEEEDMNSFMYQTVGHQIIPRYADALEIPLYRRELRGSAVQTGRYYDTSEQGQNDGDETEDLFCLLQDILKEHPEVEAVSSGAILSTYQRTRVESVATRLGLIPLAFLWQYPALPPAEGRPESLTGLLDDMEAAGCDARIIKIATGGMKESLLWARVTDPWTRTRLVNGMAPFFSDREFWLRAAVLGEGGEYETLAIDGPFPLWKKRLAFCECEMKTLTGEGGVHYLRLGKAWTEKKGELLIEDGRPTLQVPQLYDAQFDIVESTVSKLSSSSPPEVEAKSHPGKVSTAQAFSFRTSETTKSFSHILLSNVTADEADADAAGQMKSVVAKVKAALSDISPPVSLSGAVFALLVLSSMSDFGFVNPIYATLFTEGKPNPPARVTVAADLPPRIKVSLNLIVCRRHRSQLRGLHVQSRSYWAPANIGPYSQAICEPLDIMDDKTNVHDAGAPEIVHLAGQIPLIPPSMEMLQDSIQQQAVLSLQHLWRVGQERGVNLWPWGVSFLTSNENTWQSALVCLDVWTKAHEYQGPIDDESGNDMEEEDIWHTRLNRLHLNDKARNSIGRHLHPLPNKAVSAGIVPPFLAAEVVALPRHAPIEWWSMGVANIADNPSKVSLTSKSWPWGSVNILRLAIGGSEDYSKQSETMLTAVFVHAGSQPQSVSSTKALIEETIGASAIDSNTAEATAFLDIDGDMMSRYRNYIQALCEAPMIIPCRSLWGSCKAAKEDARRLEPLCAAFLIRVAKT